MRDMFQRINNYIIAFLNKAKPDKLRQFQTRIADSYRPFDKINLDFKSMAETVSGYNAINGRL